MTDMLRDYIRMVIAESLGDFGECGQLDEFSGAGGGGNTVSSALGPSGGFALPLGSSVNGRKRGKRKSKSSRGKKPQ